MTRHRSSISNKPFPIKLLDSPAWPKILLYLTLADLEQLSQSDQKLKRIVNSYLQNGNPLVIDSETVHLYPVNRQNESFYETTVSLVTNLVIIGLSEVDLDKIFKQFPRISKLTMRNVQIFRKVSPRYNKNYPRKLRHLTLIDYDFDREFLDQWLRKLNYTLLTLHLEGGRRH